MQKFAQQKKPAFYGIAFAQSATDLIGTYCKSDAAGNIQGCLQGLYNAGVMLAIAIAFLFAVFGAFKYITGAASNQKGAGKQMITNAITGLVIIFISGTVLYWVNPEIFNAQLILYNVTKLDPPTIDAEVSPIYDGDNASINPAGPTVSNAQLRATIETQLQQYGRGEFYIGKIIFDCSDNTAAIFNHRNEQIASLPVRFGENGCSDPGTGRQGDNKTTIGNFRAGDKKACLDNPKGCKSSLGPYLGQRIIRLVNSQRPAILIHGSWYDNENDLRPTWGCVRMRNGDLAVLYDYILTRKTQNIVQR